MTHFTPRRSENGTNRTFMFVVIGLSVFEWAFPFLWRNGVSFFVSAWASDEGYHLLNAWKYWDALWNHSYHAGLAELFSNRVTHGAILYPPIVYLLSAASQVAAGFSGWPSVYLGQLPFFLLLNLSLFRLGNSADPKYGGLIAVLFLAACPLFYIHLGVYNLQLPLAAWMPVLILALTSAWNAPSKKNMFFLGLSMAAAFLTYFWAPILMAAPIAVFFVAEIVSTRHKGNFLLLSAIALGVFALLIGPYLLFSDAWPWLKTVAPKLFSVDFVRRNIEPDATQSVRFLYLRQIPSALGIVLPCAIYSLFKMDFKNRTTLLLLTAVAGGVIALTAVASAHEDRLLPLCVLCAPIAAAGIVRTKWFMAKPIVPFVCLVAFLAYGYGTLPNRNLRSEQSKPDLSAFGGALQQRCAESAEKMAVVATSSEVYFSMKYFLVNQKGQCLSPERLYLLAAGVPIPKVTHILQLTGEDAGAALQSDFLRYTPKFLKQIRGFENNPASWKILAEGGKNPLHLALYESPDFDAPPAAETVEPPS